MQGVLLMNLGTPDAPDTASVRRYLREFLHDPRVVDLNPVGRALLVEGIILPTRPAKSAAAYQKIWTQEGSPLLVHSLALRDEVQKALGPRIRVELAMRYGKPAIADALESMRVAGVSHLVVAPLYPQYSSAATGSSVERVFELMSARDAMTPLSVLPAFPEDPGFIDAFAAVGAPVLERERPDHILFSFHGLPERQVRKSDHSGTHCLASASCCDSLGAANRDCYRAQCFATARALAKRLALADGSWTVTFQSRLGRTPWITPHTDVVLPQLAAQGKKRLAIFCPAFVADCLETLEEIGLRADEQFRAAGGEKVTLVPSLNSSAAWVQALVALLRPCMAR
ncbi:MAG: ferrochelatase [Deltaproteobacteria bacterium]|nr:ferrochelatase [Deltaproteobacteria bacterium]